MKLYLIIVTAIITAAAIIGAVISLDRLDQQRKRQQAEYAVQMEQIYQNLYNLQAQRETQGLASDPTLDEQVGKLARQLGKKTAKRTQPWVNQYGTIILPDAPEKGGAR